MYATYSGNLFYPGKKSTIRFSRDRDVEAKTYSHPTPDRCLSRVSAHPSSTGIYRCPETIILPQNAPCPEACAGRAVLDWEILFANTTVSISDAEFVTDQSTHVVKLNNWRPPIPSRIGIWYVSVCKFTHLPPMNKVRWRTWWKSMLHSVDRLDGAQENFKALQWQTKSA